MVRSIGHGVAAKHKVCDNYKRGAKLRKYNWNLTDSEQEFMQKISMIVKHRGLNEGQE